MFRQTAVRPIRVGRGAFLRDCPDRHAKGVNPITVPPVSETTVDNGPVTGREAASEKVSSITVRRCPSPFAANGRTGSSL